MKLKIVLLGGLADDLESSPHVVMVQTVRVVEDTGNTCECM